MSSNEKHPIDETEWLAQERGMRAALGDPQDDLDASAASYRLVAEALRSSHVSEPPTDFASGVAASVVRQEVGIERLLSRLLLTAFAVAVVFTVVQYGGECLEMLQRLPGKSALAWILTGAACMVLSWIPRQLLNPPAR